MSTFTEPTEAPRALRSAPRGTSTESRDRTIRRAALIVSIIVGGWSIVELVSLSVRHTTGPELYGVLVAAFASGAGIANVALLRSARPRALVILAVVVVWAVVALGGVAGTVAHIVGPPIAEGPIDPRVRPIAAPLAFTLLGLVGGAALIFGQRAALRGIRNPWKE